MDVTIHQVGESTITNLLAKFFFCDPNRLVGVRGARTQRTSPNRESSMSGYIVLDKRYSFALACF